MKYLPHARCLFLVSASALLACSLVCTRDGFAEAHMMVGKTKSEILREFGKPEEKIELETKRLSHWKYSDQRSIVFREGKVLSYTAEDRKTFSEQNASKTAVASIEPKSPPLNESRNTVPKEKAPLTFSGTDVFREIAKLESSNDSEPAPGRPKSRTPVRPRGR